LHNNNLDYIKDFDDHLTIWWFDEMPKDIKELLLNM